MCNIYCIAQYCIKVDFIGVDFIACHHGKTCVSKGAPCLNHYLATNEQLLLLLLLLLMLTQRWINLMTMMRDTSDVSLGCFPKTWKSNHQFMVVVSKKVDAINVDIISTASTTGVDQGG